MNNRGTDRTEPRKDPVVVQILADPTVSYASYQNNIPLLRSLRITNATEASLREIELSVRCEPEFADGLSLRFERLDPKETRGVDALDLKFRHQYLTELNEAERGRVIVRVSVAGEEVAVADHPVDVLAYDQWAGARALPELLAAFSLPNDPAVDRMIFQAGELLAKAGGDRSMNGYQSKNREDVWAQISALYSAIGASGLHYSEPPASFTNDGQKIRTPARVFSGGIATCLDLAMLFASCLEQAGLNPVVLIKKRHAWVGCWLINTTFPTATFDDGQAVRKRVASGELIAFETTAVTRRPRPSLGIACERGLEHLQEEGEFQYAIDVKRARIEQMRPLPSKTEAATAWKTSHRARRRYGSRSASALPPLDSETFLLDERAPGNTGRRLATGNQAAGPHTAQPSDQFQADEDHAAAACARPGASGGCPRRWTGMGSTASDRTATILGRRRRRAAYRRGPRRDRREAAMMKELLAAVEPKVLDTRLYEIYSTARLGLEGGASTLYLALGFLHWTEDERAETLISPILLMPVTLSVGRCGQAMPLATR